MHNRSIRKNRFNLPSMRRLWDRMGEFDALVEYNECTVRQFIAKWEQQKERYPSYAAFITEQAAEVEIKLGYINIDDYRQEIYHWYLVHPYGCIDNFVKECKKDLKVFGIDINLDHDGKNSLEKLIAGLKEADISVSVEDYKLQLDKYYRRCRNHLAHKLSEAEKSQIKTLYETICEDKKKEKIFWFYPNQATALSGPNQFTFDDYTLCTANLKNICDTLTTDIYAAIDWRKFKIEETPLYKKILKYSQNIGRAIKSIKQYLSTEYGITADDNILFTLQDKIAR